MEASFLSILVCLIDNLSVLNAYLTIN